MAEIVWLLEETILTIHQRQIAEHGGSGGLETALNALWCRNRVQ